MNNSSAMARAEAICLSCNCTLEALKAGGRRPEVVAVKWEVIRTMAEEGYGKKEIARILGISTCTCRDYLRGDVKASRDVHVRDVMLDPEAKRVRRNEHGRPWK